MSKMLGRCFSEKAIAVSAPILKTAEAPGVDVFLGGACDPTTWRADFIPLLKARGLTYYNPQVGEWHEGLIAIEAAQKESCKILYFEIGPETTAMASCVEAAYYIGRGRAVVLSLRPFPEGRPESQDVNRMRTFLRKLAAQHKVPVFEEPGFGVADWMKLMLYEIL